MTVLKMIRESFPKYKCVLPICKKEVYFTPFKIKDAKNIAIILQEQNKHLAFSTMIDIIKENTENLNVMELTGLDAEYLFLQIRSKSVDENLNLIFNNQKVQLNINDITFSGQIQEKTISVGSDIVLSLKTPKVKQLLKLKSFDKNELMKASIQSVSIKNEVYECNKFLTDELKEILENLPLKVGNKFEEFLNSEPQLCALIDINNEKKKVTGILNFFTYR